MCAQCPGCQKYVAVPDNVMANLSRQSTVMSDGSVVNAPLTGLDARPLSGEIRQRPNPYSTPRVPITIQIPVSGISLSIA